MKYVKQAEDALGGAFKDLPALPASSKEGLVKALPWIALIFGVLQVVASYGVWKLADYTNRINDIVNTYAAAVGVHGTGISNSDKFIIYVGAIVLLVDGIIGILAYKELAKRSRKGWDLLFLASLVNVVYGVIAVFINDRGVSSLVWSLIGSAIGFYLLFQVREKYGKAKAVPAK